MKDILELIATSTLVNNVLSIILILSGVLISILLIFREKTRELSTKIVGIFLVVSMAFISNHWFVYTCTVFIVATIITNLDFLEKLAAILMRSKEYWDHQNKALEKANLSEILDSKKEEATNELAVESTTNIVTANANNKVDPVSVKDRMNTIINFENRILSLLVDPDKGLFLQHHFFTGMRLKDKNRIMIFDAIAEGPNTTYIIEIKATGRKKIVEDALIQITKYMAAYENSQLENAKKTAVRGIIVLPVNENISDFCSTTIGVLKFDPSTETFTNKDVLFNWIYGNHSS